MLKENYSRQRTANHLTFNNDLSLNVGIKGIRPTIKDKRKSI